MDTYSDLLAATQKEKHGRSRTDLDAYLAGFFDGEGHISIGRDPRREYSCYVDIGAAQISREPLELFVKVYGGIIYGKSFTGRGRSKPCLAWKCSKAKDVMWALYRMLPWLIVKREKARVAMIVLQNRPHFLSGGLISKYQKTAITKALKNVHVVRRGKRVCLAEQNLIVASDAPVIPTELISLK